MRRHFPGKSSYKNWPAGVCPGELRPCEDARSVREAVRYLRGRADLVSARSGLDPQRNRGPPARNDPCAAEARQIACQTQSLPLPELSQPGVKLLSLSLEASDAREPECRRWFERNTNESSAERVTARCLTRLSQPERGDLHHNPASLHLRGYRLIAGTFAHRRVIKMVPLSNLWFEIASTKTVKRAFFLRVKRRRQNPG